MLIKITRAFSKKVQLKQFEPIESFAGAELEAEVTSPDGRESTKGILEKEMEKLSKFLDDFVQREVDKSVSEALNPSPKETLSPVETDKAPICGRCGGRIVHKDGGLEKLNKEGLCKQCEKEDDFNKKNYLAR